MPLSRFEERGITWPCQVKIFSEVVDFLTRVCLENVWDSGRVKIKWILDAFNKVFISDFNPLFTSLDQMLGNTTTPYNIR